MLHYQSWKGCQKNSYLTSLLLLLALCIVTSCNKGAHQKEDITMEAFSALKTPVFEMTPSDIHSALGKYGQIGKDSLSPASRTALFYKQSNGFLWIDRQGVKPAADSLVNALRQLNTIGFSGSHFKLKEIEEDLLRCQLLDFDEQHPAKVVIPRLDYNMTSAYLHYLAGQRYGFVNPRAAIGGMYDVAIERPNASFYQSAFHKILNDSVGESLRMAEPQSSLYRQLKQQLTDSSSDESRRRILINMERCRWRDKKPMPTTGKRIVVNIPAFMLYAYGPDSTMEMRIGCGKVITKTPLLSSAIEYMQVNPEWSIPQSIVNNDVLSHAGDSGYFARHRYYIADRSTGKKVPISSVSSSMLASGKYRVAQDGGRGNSLGRIVFRFKNNFSVYLHDTSTPAFFQNAFRGVSHGCVRVQRPFDLACFLLGNTVDEWTFDKIRISMDIPPVTQQGIDYVRTHHPGENDNGRRLPYRLVTTLQVTPHVPLYITYYTIFPDLSGQLRTYPDVYGYDQSVWNHLKKYI